jgi:hypothetical protein
MSNNMSNNSVNFRSHLQKMRRNPTKLLMVLLAIMIGLVATSIAAKFGFLDIRLLDRSGNGNELDLIKALSIGIVLLCVVSRRNSLTVAILLVIIICFFVAAHPIITLLLR